MKVVFVQPNVGFKGHTWEALGIGYLASFLKAHYPGHIDIDFYSGFYDSDDEIVRGAEDADVIGFGCTSPQFGHALRLAHRLKNPKNFVVVGGIHPSILPDLVLRERCVDAVVVGEGERAILEVVNDVANGTQQRRYEPAHVRDLDELPFPDREVIKNERNLQQSVLDGGPRTTSVLSSRGCPFRCSFCCSQALWRRDLRLRSPANILDEVQHLIGEWGLQFLKFADDTFTMNRQRVIDFCNLKLERRISIPFGANAHVNTIDKEVLTHLARSGCQELWYGVESGSPRILKEMHKNTDVERIRNAFRLTKEYGIKTRAYFLLGLPSETGDDIAQTEALCDELQPDIVGFTLLAPFPGNEYYDDQSMSGWDWSTFDEYGNGWVRTDTLTNQQLKDIQQRLVSKYRAAAAFRQRAR